MLFIHNNVFSCGKKVIWMSREMCINQAGQKNYVGGFWCDRTARDVWDFFTRGRVIMDYRYFGQKVIGSESGLRLFPSGCRTHGTLASVGDVSHVWRLWANRKEMHCSSCLWTNKPTLIVRWSPQKYLKLFCYSQGKNDKTVHVFCYCLFLKLFLDCLCFCTE